MKNEKKEAEKNKKKYLVIHGHYYQPPRENPWLEEIEIQKSAYPFHDWNERINFECYKPNAFSKIFGRDGKVVKMVNNYSKMSFNFGPTLLSWLEKSDSETYEKILEADKISQKENNGHGNAIAQVYNHIIMPLADEKDKETQIKWGVYDFEKRFARKPEGMWLAETAIDYKTIESLIENNIKYTILSPYQASKIRTIGDNEQEWVDVLGGKIDATMAYRCFSKIDKNKYLDIFFYDGPISNSMGFQDTLHDSGKFLSKLKLPLNENATHSQIINVATDGETYGHHKKFADLTLSHLLFEAAPNEDFIVTNYANYLEQNPPKYEVIINEGKGEGTSWSCAHGVDRWKDDCGCNSGGNHGWNQKWRKPLREGLNALRDKLQQTFEREGKKYLKDVWRSRNNYIDIILDRSYENTCIFFEKEAIRELEIEEKINVLKLLEMQRNSMLMFTSCGWFFDEISGIETQQIMLYAAKAIQLAQEFTNEDLEGILFDYLKNAQSNISDMGNAKNIYHNHIKPKIVTFEKIVAHYAISSLFEENNLQNIYTYEIEEEDKVNVVEGALTLGVGKLKVKDCINHEIRHMVYGMIRFGSTDFRCSVKNVFSNSEYIEIKKAIFSKLESRFSIVESMRGIDMYISREYYTFKDLLLEEKRKILQNVTNKFFEEYKNIYEKIYFESSRVVEALTDAGLFVPEEYKISAEYTLTNKTTDMAMDILENIDKADDMSNLIAFINTAKKWKYNLKMDKIEYSYKMKLNELMEKIEKFEITDYERLLKMYQVAHTLGININTNYSQFKFYELGIKHYKNLNKIEKDLFLSLAKNMGFLEDAFK